MSQSLKTLVTQASELESALIESNGEITPEIEALLEAKDVHLPHKIDNYALLMDRMDTVSEFYKMQAEKLMRLAKAAENVQDRCMYNLKTAMQSLGESEIQGINVRFKLVPSNPSVIIESESTIDGHYKVTETITKIDKKKIAEDLKLGVPVAGAKLERGVSIRRYINSPAKKLKVSNE